MDAPRAELERTELGPFRQALAAGCPAVLVAHVRYPALDPAWPASLSPAVVTGLLRGELGFGGLVLSDDLEMDAVRRQWGVDGAAVRFLEAGGDLALVCRDADARDSTVAAVGQALDAGDISPEAAAAARHRRRVLRAWVEGAATRPDLGVIGCPEHRDLVAEVLARAGDPGRSRG